MKILFLLAILLIAINAASSTNQLSFHIHVPSRVAINQTKPVQLVNSVQVDHTVNTNYTTGEKKQNIYILAINNEISLLISNSLSSY